MTVRSPKTQGVIGFASGGHYDLPGVELEIKTPFVSLIFTPLDDRPLVESEQILITAMARDRQKGSKFNADWSALEVVGGPPLLLEPVQATIKLAGDQPAKVEPLDIYGVPTETIVTHENNSFIIDGRYASYYYQVKR